MEKIRKKKRQYLVVNIINRKVRTNDFGIYVTKIDLRKDKLNKLI